MRSISQSCVVVWMCFLLVSFVPLVGAKETYDYYEYERFIDNGVECLCTQACDPECTTGIDVIDDCFFELTPVPIGESPLLAPPAPRPPVARGHVAYSAVEGMVRITLDVSSEFIARRGPLSYAGLHGFMEVRVPRRVNGVREDVILDRLDFLLPFDVADTGRRATLTTRLSREAILEREPRARYAYVIVDTVSALLQTQTMAEPQLVWPRKGRMRSRAVRLEDD